MSQPRERIAVLDDYQRVASSIADWQQLGTGVAVEFFHDHIENEDELAARLEPFSILAVMRERTQIPRSLIERLPNLRFLVTSGMRNAALDMEALAEHGVTVAGTESSTSGIGTVEMTWALILAVMRRVPQEDRALRDGRWQTAVGHGVHGKTLGVYGLGRIGAKVAEIGRAFGMKTLAWSANLTPEKAAAEGAEYAPLDELLARSDVFSIHVVASKRTRGTIGRREIGLMKKGAVLINTARGPIADEAAIVEALRAGRLGGAGIDVYTREPLPHTDPLLTAPNTVLTPHLGYVTYDGYTMFYTQMVEAIAGWLSGNPVRVIGEPASRAQA